jgi:hypothetical protein
MSETLDSPSDSTRGLSRRSLLTAAALSLPAAVAFASATGPASPASAAGGSGSYAKFLTGSNGSIIGSISFDKVPSNAVPVGGYGLYLEGTNLWYGNSVLATGVSKARGNRNNVREFFNIVQNGVALSVHGSNGSVQGVRTWPSVPSTAEPAGAYGTFLDQGNLWYFGTIVYTGVAKATGLSAGQSQWTDCVALLNDSARTFNGLAGNIGQRWTQSTRVPLSSTSTRVPGWWLNGGDLWWSNVIRASNVTSVSGTIGENLWHKVSYVANGLATTVTGVNGTIYSTATFPAVPASARAVGPWGTFLDGTNLWYNNAIVETDVLLAVGDSTQNGTDHISLIKRGAGGVRGGVGAPPPPAPPPTESPGS